jgi:hypothetical protein
MEFTKTPNRIYLNDENGKTIAEVTFLKWKKTSSTLTTLLWIILCADRALPGSL